VGDITGMLVCVGGFAESFFFFINIYISINFYFF
jgi:hypothetical protein